MNKLALSILISALQYHQTLGFGVNSPCANHNLPTTIISNDPQNSAFVQRKSRTCRFLTPKEKSDDDYEYEEYEYVEGEEDDDAEYEYVEVEAEYEEEDAEETEEEEDVEKEEIIPIEDDPDDPNYNAQKKLIIETIARREAFAELQEAVDGDDSPEFLKDNLEEYINSEFDKAGLKEKDIEKYLKKLSISEEEAEEAIQLKMDEDSGKDYAEKAADFVTNLGSDLDAFPADDDPVMNGIKAEDLVRLQKAMEGLVGTIKGFQDGSMIDNKQAMIRPHHELEQLDRQTYDEIRLCLNASATDADGIAYGESIKNEDPLRWLLYDLDFDVANLMLAACKHNPEAPLLLNHWMPQLCAYSRYAEVRENNFQFTWEDCDKADMDELKRYYKGLGYDEIPTFEAQETNIVNLETEYDQEDMTMAAFENWMDEVYIEEDENLYFDDEDFQPENNVFDFNYGMEDSDSLTSFKGELQEFETEHRNETQEWRDKYVRKTNYTYTEDAEGAEQFRGHLVVACCGSDKDLALAEKITHRMKEKFEKQVYVETRVYSHARQEDNLYEIWIESYDIELLHSRRGAFYNSKQWFGPADVDDEQLENIVKRVEFLISDDARYSYRLHEFVEEV